MSLAAIHSNPETADIVGVWRGPEDCAYVQGTSDEKTSAQERMENKFSDEDWDTWVLYLNDSRPSPIRWDAVLTLSGESSVELLNRLRNPS